MLRKRKVGGTFESHRHITTRKSADTGFALRAVEMPGLQTRCTKPTAMYQMHSREAELIKTFRGLCTCSRQDCRPLTEAGMVL